MGTVHELRKSTGQMTVADAVQAYLGQGLVGVEQRNTRRTYGGFLRRLSAEFGPATDPDPAGVAEWFTRQWGGRSPSTWNVGLDALRSAQGYWDSQGWQFRPLTASLTRRKVAPDRSRALSRAEVEELLTRGGVGLREKTLWVMLYETAARSGEILALDAGDLDLPNLRAKVRRKGGAMDIVVWQTRTARLLPRLLDGRKTGPLFVTSRKARVPLPAGDLDDQGRARLSYEQAEQLFKAASGEPRCTSSGTVRSRMRLRMASPRRC